MPIVYVHLWYSYTCTSVCHTSYKLLSAINLTCFAVISSWVDCYCWDIRNEDKYKKNSTCCCMRDYLWRDYSVIAGKPARTALQWSRRESTKVVASLAVTSRPSWRRTERMLRRWKKHASVTHARRAGALTAQRQTRRPDHGRLTTAWWCSELWWWLNSISISPSPFISFKKQ